MYIYIYLIKISHLGSSYWLSTFALRVMAGRVQAAIMKLTGSPVNPLRQSRKQLPKGVNPSKWKRVNKRFPCTSNVSLVI